MRIRFSFPYLSAAARRDERHFEERDIYYFRDELNSLYWEYCVGYMEESEYHRRRDVLNEYIIRIERQTHDPSAADWTQEGF